MSGRAPWGDFLVHTSVCAPALSKVVPHHTSGVGCGRRVDFVLCFNIAASCKMCVVLQCSALIAIEHESRTIHVACCTRYAKLVGSQGGREENNS